MTTQTSRLEGLTTAVAIKAPCKATSDVNLTLSGEQTIDGVSCTSGDRILVRAQNTASENGIYIVSTSAWQRAADFNGARDVVQGTEVRVTQGDNFSGRYRITTSNPITIGATGITFVVIAESTVTSLSELAGDSDDISQGSTNLYMTLAEKSKLAGIEALAEVNDGIVAGSNITVTGGSGNDWTITGATATTPDLNDLGNVTADATVNGGIYGFSYSTVGGGSYDDTLLGSLAMQDASSVTITGGNATLTGGTFTDAYTTDLQAATSGGLNFKTNGGSTAFSFGGGGSTTLVLNGSLSFGGTTYTDATGADTKLVSGTAGASGNLVQWNVDGDAVDSAIASSDVLVDSDIGVTVQAHDADILKADTADTLTAGYSATSYSGGTVSSGTYTVTPANGNIQHYTNGGAHTLAPSATVSAVILEITNNSVAGAITTSGFDLVDGDSFDTTNGNAFQATAVTMQNYSTLTIKALQ